jgi:hypothetical protein
MGSGQPLTWQQQQQQQEQDVASARLSAAEAADFDDSLSQWWTDLVVR